MTFPRQSHFKTENSSTAQYLLNIKLKVMQNSWEDELSSLWKKSVYKSILGLKGMQGQERNTTAQKMKGITEKENVKQREKRTAVRMGERIFPVSELQGGALTKWYVGLKV